MREQEFSSDGQLHDVDRPVVDPVAAKPPTEPVDIFAASEPASAAQRLRDFEDEHLGADTPRHQGMVERGHGSHLRALSDELRRMHTDLETAVRSESEKGGG